MCPHANAQRYKHRSVCFENSNSGKKSFSQTTNYFLIYVENGTFLQTAFKNRESHKMSPINLYYDSDLKVKETAWRKFFKPRRSE